MTIKEFNEFCLKNYKGCEIVISDINCNVIARLTEERKEYYCSMSDFPVVNTVDINAGLFSCKIEVSMLNKIESEKDNLLSINTFNLFFKHFAKVKNYKLSAFFNFYNYEEPNVDFFYNDKHINCESSLPVYFEETIKKTLKFDPDNIKNLYKNEIK